MMSTGNDYFPYLTKLADLTTFNNYANEGNKRLPTVSSLMGMFAYASKSPPAEFKVLNPLTVTNEFWQWPKPTEDLFKLKVSGAVNARATDYKNSRTEMIDEEPLSETEELKNSSSPAIVYVTSEVPLAPFIGVSPSFYANLPSDYILMTSRVRGIHPNLAVQLKAYGYSEETFDMNNEEVGSGSIAEENFSGAEENETYEHQAGICARDFESAHLKVMNDALYSKEHEGVSFCVLPIKLETLPFPVMDELDFIPFRLQLKFEFLRVVPINTLKMLFDEIDFYLSQQLECYDTRKVRKFREFVWLFIESQLFDERKSAVSEDLFALYGRTYYVYEKPKYRRWRYINLCSEGILVNVARCLNSIPAYDWNVAIAYIVDRYLETFDYILQVLRQERKFDWNRMDYTKVLRLFREILRDKKLYKDPIEDKDNPAVLRYTNSIIAWQDYDSLYSMSFVFSWIQNLVPSQALQLFSRLSNVVSHQTKAMPLPVLVESYWKIHSILENKLSHKIPRWIFNWSNNPSCLFNIYYQREQELEIKKCIRLITEDIFAFITKDLTCESDYVVISEKIPDFVEALLPSTLRF